MLPIAAAAAALAALALRKRSEEAAAKQAPRPKKPTAFGAAIRDEFMLNWAFTHLNHGSYGACPRVVFDKMVAEQVRLEAFPDGASLPPCWRGTSDDYFLAHLFSCVPGSVCCRVLAFAYFGCID